LNRMITYRRYRLFARQTDQALPAATVMLPITIDLLKETDLDNYVQFNTYPKPLEILNRLQAGHLCFVVRYEKQIVHACWAVTNNKIAYAILDPLHRKVMEHLARDEVYVYDSFTAPNFRGKGISPARALQMVGYFREAGCKRMIAIVKPENKSSIRAMEKAGYHPTRSMMHLLNVSRFAIAIWSDAENSTEGQLRTR